MATATVKYLGGLRTECTHLQSGTVIHTDAPTDNHGKGEKFSPTDLVATAYASCMLSIIGIYCNEHGHSFENGSATVTKIMASGPRRIGKLVIEIDLKNNGWDEATIEKVKRAALACPVAKSVSEDIELEITFHV
jgi:organic hydroperoxide reductase OsmC/OhrA